jgi:hypothetical protein
VFPRSKLFRGAAYFRLFHPQIFVKSRKYMSEQDAVKAGDKAASGKD